MANVLFLDIETKAMKVYTFGIFTRFISHENIIEDWDILSIAYSWNKKEKIHYIDRKNNKSDKQLTKEIAKLLDKADIVIAHNGDNFDLKKIQERILYYKIKRPSNFDTVDTKKLCSKYFGFTSNSLAYVCRRLGISQKLSHKKFPGLELWKEIDKNNKQAWQELKIYNLQDVKCLKELFHRIQPYCKLRVFDQYAPKECACGSDKIVKNGLNAKRDKIIQRYICQSCGAPYQETKHGMKRI